MMNFPVDSQCDVCGLITASKYEMRRHKKLHEPLVDRYKCPFRDCTQDCANWTNLRIHYARKHGAILNKRRHIEIGQAPSKYPNRMSDVVQPIFDPLADIEIEPNASNDDQLAILEGEEDGEGDVTRVLVQLDSTDMDEIDGNDTDLGVYYVKHYLESAETQSSFEASKMVLSYQQDEIPSHSSTVLVDKLPQSKLPLQPDNGSGPRRSKRVNAPAMSHQRDENPSHSATVLVEKMPQSKFPSQSDEKGPRRTKRVIVKVEKSTEDTNIIAATNEK